MLRLRKTDHQHQQQYPHNTGAIHDNEHTAGGGGGGGGVGNRFSRLIRKQNNTDKTSNGRKYNNVDNHSHKLNINGNTGTGYSSQHNNTSQDDLELKPHKSLKLFQGRNFHFNNNHSLPPHHNNESFDSVTLMSNSISSGSGGNAAAGLGSALNGNPLTTTNTNTTTAAANNDELKSISSLATATVSDSGNGHSGSHTFLSTINGKFKKPFSKLKTNNNSNSDSNNLTSVLLNSKLVVGNIRSLSAKSSRAAAVPSSKSNRRGVSDIDAYGNGNGSGGATGMGAILFDTPGQGAADYGSLITPQRSAQMAHESFKNGNGAIPEDELIDSHNTIPVEKVMDEIDLKFTAEEANLIRWCWADGSAVITAPFFSSELLNTRKANSRAIHGINNIITATKNGKSANGNSYGSNDVPESYPASFSSTFQSREFWQLVANNVQDLSPEYVHLLPSITHLTTAFTSIIRMMVVGNLENLAAMKEFFFKLGRVHERLFNCSNSIYNALGDGINQALLEVYGDFYTPDIEALWMALYGFIASCMLVSCETDALLPDADVELTKTSHVFE